MGQTISLPPAEVQDMILVDMSAEDLGALARTSKELREEILAFAERDALVRSAFIREADPGKSGNLRKIMWNIDIGWKRLKCFGSEAFLEHVVEAAIVRADDFQNWDNYGFSNISLVLIRLATVPSAPHSALFWSLAGKLERFDFFPASYVLLRLNREIELGRCNDLFTSPEGLRKIADWCERTFSWPLYETHHETIRVTSFVTAAIRVQNEEILRNLVKLMEQDCEDKSDERIQRVTDWMCSMETGIAWLDKRTWSLLMRQKRDPGDMSTLRRIMRHYKIVENVAPIRSLLGFH